MLTEEEVYNGAKRWLSVNGFKVLAGQPPRGVDHLPVVEIKYPTLEKGSKKAYKPDLVAFKDGYFYIIECKPKYDLDDCVKIRNVLSSNERLILFYRELTQYKLLSKLGYDQPFEVFANHVEGMIANGEGFRADCQLNQLIVASWLGEAELY